MAEFKVVGNKMIRVGNAEYEPRKRESGETEGGTLTEIRTEIGELIFYVVGRIE